MNTNDTTNTNLKADPLVPPPQACIGLDWGDQKHSFALQARGGQIETGTLEHSAENLHRWLKELEQRFSGRPVRLGIETSRGAVIAALLQYPWLEIYPLHPTHQRPLPQRLQTLRRQGRSARRAGVPGTGARSRRPTSAP